jgi:hypothetical protein
VKQFNNEDVVGMILDIPSAFSDCSERTWSNPASLVGVQPVVSSHPLCMSCMSFRAILLDVLLLAAAQPVANDE